MNIFERVKEEVSAKAAAERYGLTVKRKRTVCPFHDDHEPSMLVDKNFKCFACGEYGDSIKLTARLLGLRPYDAAKRLAYDFGIDADSDETYLEVRAPPKKTDYRKWMDEAFLILRNYHRKLEEYRIKYAPKSLDEDYHPLFVESLLNMGRLDFLMDELIYKGRNEAKELHDVYEKEINEYRKRSEVNEYDDEK